MRRAIGLAAGMLLAAPTAMASAVAAPVQARRAASVSLDEPVARAATRFAIPPGLIRAVIAIESGGAVHAVSPRGAMGLMQLMPATWAELRLRHALGTDPFDPCDNILAGTAYLRELLDRYGDPGFLAAYNAGPGRYEAWLRGARPLPPETLSYLARISANTGPGASSAPRESVVDPEAWRRSELFVRNPAPAVQDAPGVADSRAAGMRNPLFIARTDSPQ